MDNLRFLTAWLCLYSFVLELDAVGGPKFTNSPEPIVAPLGDEVEFECSLDVQAEHIRWKHNKKLVPLTHNNVFKSQLIFRVERESQVGEYQCVAWYGSTALASTPARLSLATLGPAGPSTQRSLLVSEGNNLLINCSVPVSNPPAVIQYFKNNVTLQGGQVLGSGALLLTGVKPTDSGQYSCSVTNAYVRPSALYVPSYYNLNVLPSHAERRAPQFTNLPPESYFVQPGMNVTLECVAFGEPVPKTSWRRHDGPLKNDRAQPYAAGLRLINIQPADEGTYVCEMSNGISPSLSHKISLVVEEPPVVVKGPESDRVKEGGRTALECTVKGKPIPSIKWFLNGNHLVNDSHVRINGGRLELDGVEKRHAGWYQCMAQNVLGATFSTCQLLVVPRQVTMNSSTALPEPPQKHNPSNNSKKHHKNKNNSKEMVPPSKPMVTRLTNTSVMVRWYVPPNSGLPIQFFKVQHRELHRGKTSRWMTNNGDIAPHIRSYEVVNLTPDAYYKFRIAAVYSNMDNKLSPNSAKFHLHASPYQIPLTPRLSRLTPAGSEAIEILWDYNRSEPIVEGFYVYYRSTSSAGDYVKVTVEGEGTRNHVITHLKPDTSYEFKLQSFTAAAASEFSEILTSKTEGCSTVSPPMTESTPSSVDNESEPVNKGYQQLWVTLSAALGGLGLLFLFCAWIFWCNKTRQNSTNSEDDDVDKSRRIQMEAIHVNGHLAAHVPVSRSNDVIVNKSNSNGCCSKMNITSNPLDPEESKTQNVMKIAFITTNSCDLTARLASTAVLPTCAMESESWRQQDIPRTVDNYV